MKYESVLERRRRPPRMRRMSRRERRVASSFAMGVWEFGFEDENDSSKVSDVEEEALSLPSDWTLVRERRCGDGEAIENRDERVWTFVG